MCPCMGQLRYVCLFFHQHINVMYRLKLRAYMESVSHLKSILLIAQRP